jgi:nucleoside-diphosphate-sugar epimerase
MRLLLTGASGFIGTALLQRFIREGWQVDAVRRTPDAPDTHGVRWHRCDLWDETAMQRLLAQTRPTHLVLNAWISTPGVFWSSPDNQRWLDATTALLHAFGAQGGRSVLGLGSCAEYDWSAAQFIEGTTAERPATAYGQAKLVACQRLFTLADTYGFRAAWGRIFMPYGAGDAAERLIPSLIRQLVHHEPIALSAGTQQRDFIAVDDVAEAVARLLRREASGVFNLGTGVATSLRDLAGMIAQQLDGFAPLAAGAHHQQWLQWGALPERAEPPVLVADISKLRQQLGWQPEISLKAGLTPLITAALATPNTR